MIKELIIFNYSEKIPFEETDRWFFDCHASLVKKLPHLVKYVSYRAIHLPNSDFFPPPQFHRTEELWWPDRESFKLSLESKENKEVLADLNNPEKGPWLVEMKRAFLEKEINLLHPEMTGHFPMTMNEINGKTHVKSLYCFNYRDDLNVEQAEYWNLNHHLPLAARNFNLVRYCTYSPANDLGIDHGFVRFTELCWQDVETMMNDFQSPRGKEVIEDNKTENGEWREISETSLMSYPHVVGNEVVFI